MGKNQQHKQMQRARHAGDAAGDGTETGQDFGGADVSFHTPEWHAARIAALTTERMSWEDWKKKQKDDAAALEAQAQSEEAKMREYRAQLDADRAKRLSVGTNNAHLRDATGDEKVKKRKRKDSDKELKRKDKSKDKDKDKKKRKKAKLKKDKDKKGKRKRASMEGSSSASSGSDSDSGPNKAAANGSGGPVRLSEFLQK